MRQLVRRFLSTVLAIGIVAAGLTAINEVVAPAPAAHAIDGGDFDPGNIISDIVFYNTGTMSVSAIQSFLNSKVPTCRSGYTCLKNYRQTTQTIAADPMCSKYTGGTDESAATIIYKVAMACKINPQVILVTLEKEQALVTDDWPTAGIYRKAMGYGCPDTSDCDAEFYGFFNQVYKGAWGFKRYTMPPGTGPGTEWYTNYNWFPVGTSTNIRYSPDASCGSSPVVIKNKATSSLYFYTPYQPNRAALNNLYGTGDGCSAYGNRNFWRIFSTWFGSTKGYTAVAELMSLYNSYGGANGVLGYATTKTGVSYADGGVGQTFQGGWAYWGPSTGAFMTSGRIGNSYNILGGPSGMFGYPIGVEKDEVGGGRSQAFQNGLLYMTDGWKVHRLMNIMNQSYRALGGPAGTLGIPIDSEVKAPDGGFSQRFNNGTLYWSKLAGGVSIPKEIEALYNSLGGPGGALGYPIAQPITDANGEKRSEFHHGTIFWSATEAPRMVLRPAPAIDRISGDDRYGTAVAISKAGFPNTAPVVYVATGQYYPDALSAASSAAKAGGPLLLTQGSQLPAGVKSEIQRLKPAKIIVVGGAGVVSDTVFRALKALQPNTVRIGGHDRYETSRKVTDDAFGSVATAYLTSGQDYPDALSASAAAGSLGAPVVLVNGTQSSLDAPTATLLTSLGVRKVVVAGGTAVLSSGIEKSIKSFATTQRFAGADRYATSQLINKGAFQTADKAYLATGAGFADALAGAVLAGSQGGPLYVVPRGCVPSRTLLDISILQASKVRLFGGTGSLSADVAALKSC